MNNFIEVRALLSYVHLVKHNALKHYVNTYCT
jgi:hypothetical protein